MQIWVVALPGVWILPGEELYAEYGKNYWLDHLPTLSPAARLACISKYKYRPSELLKAGLNPDGSHPHPHPSSVHTTVPLRFASTRAYDPYTLLT